MTEALIIETILRTTRMIAVIVGALVLADHMSNQDVPPHNKRANTRAWSVIAASASLTGIIMLYQMYGEAEPLLDNTAARAVLWCGLATGLTLRAAMRAHKPWLIWLSTALMGVTGLILSLADALIG